MRVASESRVQRPPDTPELKSVKAAHAGTGDVTIDAQIQQNVDAEQTIMAAGDGTDTQNVELNIGKLEFVGLCCNN